MNKTIQGIGHVFYPESCPIENVIEYILPFYNCCISPIHNRDKLKNGQIKKAHFHLLFQGKLSEKDKRYISKITTMNYFENLFSLADSYSYLFHWNNSTNWFILNKAQYWSADIIYSERWNDNNELLQCCSSSVAYTLSDIFSFINDFSILEIYEIYDYALSINDDNLLNTISRYDRQISGYLRSRRFAKRDNAITLKNKLRDEFFEDNTLLEFKGSYIDLHSYKVALEQKFIEEKFYDGLQKINCPIDLDK